MAWDLVADRPIYTQLVEQIELKICSGFYKPGSKLPSVRDLAQEAAVNPNTMQRALAILEGNGLVHTQRTSGRFITEDEKMVEQVKNRLMKQHVDEFLDKVSKLGFEQKEILFILRKILEEGE